MTHYRYFHSEYIKINRTTACKRCYRNFVATFDLVTCSYVYYKPVNADFSELREIPITPTVTDTLESWFDLFTAWVDEQGETIAFYRSASIDDRSRLHTVIDL